MRVEHFYATVESIANTVETLVSKKLHSSGGVQKVSHIIETNPNAFQNIQKYLSLIKLVGTVKIKLSECSLNGITPQSNTVENNKRIQTQDVLYTTKFFFATYDIELFLSSNLLGLNYNFFLRCSFFFL